MLLVKLKSVLDLELVEDIHKAPLLSYDPTLLGLNLRVKDTTSQDQQLGEFITIRINFYALTC